MSGIPGAIPTDVLMLDDLGHLPFAQTGGPLLRHPISTPDDRTSIIAPTNLAFGDRPRVPGHAKMTTAPLDRRTHPREIVEAGTETGRFKTRAWRQSPPATAPCEDHATPGPLNTNNAKTARQ